MTMKWTTHHIGLALDNGANLGGADLGGADLANANLTNASLSRANLYGANLYGANLGGADLGGADLANANLTNASLGGADLYGANLSRANLSRADLANANLTNASLGGADLSRAYLGGANLHGANLGGANLYDTCLDPALTAAARKAAKINNQRGIIGYRTATSLHVGGNTYIPGHTVIAHALSWDSATACHPGIYFYPTLQQLRYQYEGRPAVKVYARAGEYTVTIKGAFRAARVRVLEEIND